MHVVVQEVIHMPMRDSLPAARTAYYKHTNTARTWEKGKCLQKPHLSLSGPSSVPLSKDRIQPRTS